MNILLFTLEETIEKKGTELLQGRGALEGWRLGGGELEGLEKLERKLQGLEGRPGLPSQGARGVARGVMWSEW